MAVRAEPLLIGAAVVFAGYLWSSPTSSVSPVQWQDGDLVVQQSRDVAVLPVFAAGDEPPSHIGIVANGDNGLVVIEAIETVTETPLATFVARGRGREFTAYRVTGLSQIQARLVVAAARSRLGTPGDFFLDEDPDQLYSSELVRMAYQAAGVGLGHTERLGTLARRNPSVMSKFMGRWAQSIPCMRRYLSYEQCWALVAHYEVISPSALVSDARAMLLYASPGLGSNIMAQAPDGPQQNARTPSVPPAS